MTTRQRLEALRAWVYENLCKGKQLKSPEEHGDVTQITMEEPSVFLGWPPTRGNQVEYEEPDPKSVAPGILIAPGYTIAKCQEEKSYDRYRNVHRPKELGQTLDIQMLFTVYEPGVRLQGFTEAVGRGEFPMELLAEGTEQGLFTLTDWMDEAARKLLATRTIPGSDLFLDEESLRYRPYAEGGYMADKRPLYYGFLTATFGGYADETQMSRIDDLLK